MSDISGIIEGLRLYNRWRRGDEEIAQPEPAEIGRLIDEVCDEAEGLKRERDEAREALLKIREIYRDGDDTYDAWKAMGDITRKAVERWI